MIKYSKFDFTYEEKTTSTSYLTMVKWLFRGFNIEEANSLRSQINNYLNDRIADEYDNPDVEFRANETDWFELLGVLVDKFDDLMLDVANDDDVEFSIPLQRDK